jgi:hypothetical protein
LPYLKEGHVWVGPAITDPEDPRLALAVACERLIRQDGRDVLVDPGLTLDRFGWDEDAAEGMTLRTPDDTVIPQGDPDAGEEDEP